MKKIKYVLSLEPSTELMAKMGDSPEEMKKAIGGLIGQAKPESFFVSTFRRLMFVVVNVEDSLVEPRTLFESFSKMGNVTIDPVSSFD